MTEKSLYLLSIIGDREFIVPIGDVVEVVPRRPVVSLPDRNSRVDGLINLRGEAISILNLSDLQEGMRTNGLFLICKKNGTKFGFLVDKADEVIEVDPEKKISLNSILGEREFGFIEGIHSIDSRKVLVLNLEKMVAA